MSEGAHLVSVSRLLPRVRARLFPLREVADAHVDVDVLLEAVRRRGNAVRLLPRVRNVLLQVAVERRRLDLELLEQRLHGAAAI